MALVKDYKTEFDDAMKRLTRAHAAILKAVTPDEARSLEREARRAILDARYHFVNLERWVRSAVSTRIQELSDRADRRTQEIIDRVVKEETLPKRSEKKSLKKTDEHEDLIEEPVLEEDELRPDVIGDAVEELVETPAVTPVETPISVPVEEPIGDAVGEPVEEPVEELVEEPKPKRKTSSKKSSKKES